MSSKSYNFRTNDYNTPEVLDDYELDRHLKFLKNLSSDANKCIDLYVKELNNRLHKT